MYGVTKGMELFRLCIWAANLIEGKMNKQIDELD
jgi:hypothetical protein